MSYLIISTIFCIAAIIILIWLHSQYHLDIVVTAVNAPQSAPLISVCIPARNEEKNIRRCVESILQQDYPLFEVIVVDDRSTDATPVILNELTEKDSRLRITTGSDLPEGWAGKPHALHQASTLAKGEWICFIDADTFLKPNALSACYAKALETKADLFTVMTNQLLGSFWERTVMPLVMTALSVGFSPRRINDPQRKDAVANGQFIMIRREIYDIIGGHEAVKDRIVEDKAISENVKWNGHRLIVADGMQLVSTRMYTSLPEMWEGWTKNIYLGLRESNSLLWLGVFGAVLAVFATVVLPLWPLAGLLWYINTRETAAIFVMIEALSVWGVLLFFRVRIAQKMNTPAWYGLLTPLGAGVFAAMMLTSAWKVLSGSGVTWRGRKYHIN